MKTTKAVLLAIGLCAAALSTGVSPAAAEGAWTTAACDGYLNFYRRLIEGRRAAFIALVEEIMPAPTRENAADMLAILKDWRVYAIELDNAVADMKAYHGLDLDTFACSVEKRIIAAGQRLNAANATALGR